MIVLDRISVEDEKKFILQNVEFVFEREGIYLLTGVNGVGKTTLLKVISGALPVDEGLVKVSEENDNIFFVPDNPFLYDKLTGKEYVDFTLSLLGKLDKSTDLDYLIKELNLDQAMDVRIEDYSLGMKKKLALVVCFLSDSQTILLDEALNGIDVESSLFIQKYMTNQLKKKLIIFATHQQHTMKFKNVKNIVLERGGLKLID